MKKIFTVRGVSGSLTNLSRFFGNKPQEPKKPEIEKPKRKVVFVRTGSCSGYYTLEEEHEK